MTSLKEDKKAAASAKWIMRDKIAVGALHVVLGEPAVGVSPALVGLMAHVSKGREWPGTLGPCPKGEVVYIDTVCARGDQIKSWLTASDARISRVHCLSIDCGAELEAEISKLVADIRNIENLRLLVIDDVEGWIEENKRQKGKDSFIPFDFFRQLQRLAENQQVAILAAAKLSLNDSSAQRELEYYMRLAPVSTVFRVTRGEDDIRELSVLRCRVGADNDAIPFRVLVDKLETGETAPRADWRKNYRLRPGESRASRKRRLAQFVSSKLYDGMPSTELYSLSEQAGYSGLGLYRIATELGWTRKKRGKKWYLKQPGRPSDHGSEILKS